MADLKRALRELADRLEAEEKGESDQELRAKVTELEQRLKRSSQAQREQLFESLTDEELRELAAQRGLIGEAAREAEEEREEEEPPAAEERPRRTRPGRKSGRPYMWTVDDAGEVRRTEIAHIYNGPDEPDEVELPDVEEQPPADSEAA